MAPNLKFPSGVFDHGQDGEGVCDDAGAFLQTNVSPVPPLLHEETVTESELVVHGASKSVNVWKIEEPLEQNGHQESMHSLECSNESTLVEETRTQIGQMEIHMHEEKSSNTCENTLENHIDNKIVIDMSLTQGIQGKKKDTEEGTTTLIKRDAVGEVAESENVHQDTATTMQPKEEKEIIQNESQDHLHHEQHMRGYIRKLSRRVQSQREDTIDERRIYQAVRDAGEHAYGVIAVEVWMLDDDNENEDMLEHDGTSKCVGGGRLIRPRGGWWRNPSLPMTDELSRLEDESHPGYIPPNPVMCGVDVAGELWTESFTTVQHHHSHHRLPGLHMHLPVLHHKDNPNSRNTDGNGTSQEDAKDFIQKIHNSADPVVAENTTALKIDSDRDSSENSWCPWDEEEGRSVQDQENQQARKDITEQVYGATYPESHLNTPTQTRGRLSWLHWITGHGDTSNQDPHHHQAQTPHSNYHKLIWRDLHSLLLDPDTAKGPRLAQLEKAGFGQAAGVPFDVRGHKGIVLYYSRGSSVETSLSGVLNKLTSPENEAYLSMAAELIGSNLAITLERRAAVASKNDAFHSAATKFRRNLLTEFRKEFRKRDMNTRNNNITNTDGDGCEDNPDESKIDKMTGKKNSESVVTAKKEAANRHPKGCHYSTSKKIKMWGKKCTGGDLQIPPTMEARQCLWTLVGSFCGLLLLSLLNEAAKSESDGDYFLLIGPFGALMTLQYGLTAAPASQPRNIVLGQSLAGAIALAFTYVPEYVLPTWIRVALGPAVAIAMMMKMGVAHPPAGAHSVLYSSGKYGWTFYFLVVLGSAMSVVPATLINNMSDKRQYPTYWGYLCAKANSSIVPRLKRAPQILRANQSVNPKEN